MENSPVHIEKGMVVSYDWDDDHREGIAHRSTSEFYIYRNGLKCCFADSKGYLYGRVHNFKATTRSDIEVIEDIKKVRRGDIIHTISGNQYPCERIDLNILNDMTSSDVVDSRLLVTALDGNDFENAAVWLSNTAFNYAERPISVPQ